MEIKQPEAYLGEGNLLYLSSNAGQSSNFGSRQGLAEMNRGVGPSLEQEKDVYNQVECIVGQ